jgi:arsenate reductase
MIVFGIGNCDTCRKARRWLDGTGQDYRWVDLRDHGICQSRLRRWLESVGPDKLVNRRSATWRSLEDGERAQADDPGSAAGLLARHPTLVKRPVIEVGDRILVGFTDEIRSAL